MKLRTIFALLVAALLLAACDSSPAVTPPAPVTKQGPPSFPPMEYPTEAPAPSLPAALRQRTPLALPSAASDSSPTANSGARGVIEGKVQQELLQIELDTAK